MKKSVAKKIDKKNDNFAENAKSKSASESSEWVRNRPRNRHVKIEKNKEQSLVNRSTRGAYINVNCWSLRLGLDM